MDRKDGALLAGVCSGIAKALDWNAWALRALFAAFLLFKTLWAVIGYAALALLFHFGEAARGRGNEKDGLESPELSERGRRIEELEKRFRDLERE